MKKLWSCLTVLKSESLHCPAELGKCPESSLAWWLLCGDYYVPTARFCKLTMVGCWLGHVSWRKRPCTLERVWDCRNRERQWQPSQHHHLSSWGRPQALSAHECYRHPPFLLVTVVACLSEQLRAVYTIRMMYQSLMSNLDWNWLKCRPDHHGCVFA